MSEPSSPPGALPPSLASAQQLGARVARGSIWLLANALLARGASFVAQLALGALLTKSDFGLYAIAISISIFAAVLRDGGARQVLTQRQDEYGRLVGTVFWLAMTTNIVIGIVIAALGPLSTVLYGDARIATLLYIIGLSQPLSTPAAMLTTRLHIDMRFREASIIATVSAFVRYGGCVMFAYGGFGALSFVLPLPILAAVEWALGWYYVRESHWSSALGVEEWPPLVKSSQWVLLGNLGIAGMNLGVSMIIGLLVPMTIVGVYYFANQIIIQVGMLITANLFQVLLPAFSSIANEPQRLLDAIRRSLAQIGLIAAPTCLGLASTFSPLEALAWHGKWADASSVVGVLGAFYPAAVVTSVSMAVMQARGQFRASAISLLLVAASTLSGAALGAAIHGTAFAIAFYSGLGGMLGSLAMTLGGLRDIGIHTAYVLRAIGLPWLAAIVAAIPAMLVDRYLRDRIGGLEGGIFALVRTASAGFTFCVLFGAACWLFFRQSIRDAAAAFRRRGSAT